MKPEPLSMLPEWYALERRYQMLVESHRLGLSHVPLPAAYSRPKKKYPKQPNKLAETNGRKANHCRPVLSDRGEGFPSATAAAANFGLRRTAVVNAIWRGGECAGRRWKYVTGIVFESSNSTAH